MMNGIRPVQVRFLYFSMVDLKYLQGTTAVKKDEAKSPHLEAADLWQLFFAMLSSSTELSRRDN